MQAKCLNQREDNSKLLVKHDWERSDLTRGRNDQQLEALKQEIQAAEENSDTASEDAQKSYEKLISPEAQEAEGKPPEKSGELSPIYSDVSSWKKCCSLTR